MSRKFLLGFGGNPGEKKEFELTNIRQQKENHSALNYIRGNIYL